MRLMQVFTIDPQLISQELVKSDDFTGFFIVPKFLKIVDPSLIMFSK